MIDIIYIYICNSNRYYIHTHTHHNEPDLTVNIISASMGDSRPVARKGQVESGTSSCCKSKGCSEGHEDMSKRYRNQLEVASNDKIWTL